MKICCLFDDVQSEPFPADLSVQKEWDSILYKHIYEGLLSRESVPAERARLLAVASEDSSNWLNAIPVPDLGLKMDDQSLRLAVGLRLGSEMVVPHKCTCGQLVDPWARHGLSCKKAKGTQPRHYAVNGLIKRAMAAAGMPADLEPEGLCKNIKKQPDVVTLIPWSEGKHVVWDYTCHDTVCQSYVGGTSREAGKAADEAEQAKNTTYNELAAKFVVVPIANETFGSWGTLSLHFIRPIGDRIVARTGNKRATYDLLQNISMTVQKGNIASILGTPPVRKHDELFNL